jgi:hypothetical protein
MTPKEKEKLSTKFIEELTSFQEKNGVSACVEFVHLVDSFVDKIHSIGRMEGFKDGYNEARKKLEQKFGKLN